MIDLPVWGGYILTVLLQAFAANFSLVLLFLDSQLF